MWWIPDVLWISSTHKLSCNQVCVYYKYLLFHLITYTTVQKHINNIAFYIPQKRTPRQGHVIEQLGTYDPMVNVHGEKLVALNTERINHWIGQGAGISTSCAVVLGECVQACLTNQDIYPLMAKRMQVTWTIKQ